MPGCTPAKARSSAGWRPESRLVSVAGRAESDTAAAIVDGAAAAMPLHRANAAARLAIRKVLAFMARFLFCERDNTGILLPVTPPGRHKSSMLATALSPTDTQDLGAALTRMGLLTAGGNFTATSLTGGVSCDV